MTRAKPTTGWTALWLALSLIATVGCGKTLRTEYGKSRGTGGDQSINGFGVLRRSYENSGWKTRDVNRLNQRLSNVDAIVWIPQHRDTVHDDAREWLDEWLSEETRTLIYLVPDDGCEIRYLEAARQLAPSNQRLAYRRRIARLQTDQLISRLSEESTISNGWFAIERLPEAATVAGESGEWMISSANASATSPRMPPQSDAAVDYQVIAAPTATTTPATASTPSSQGQPPTHTSPTPTSPGPASVSPPGQAITDAAVDVQHTTLVNAADGSPVIVRLTADRWGDSKLIVIGSGSLLCNFAMTTSQSQAIASRLIAETGSGTGITGFMTTDYRGAVVSNVDPEINQLSGMELLTVWPLSLIVLHLAIMGLIACMALLPIFGRPRQHQSASMSDFADHLDAVAALMHKSGGEEFARRRVSDYMKRIRGETTGPWVLPETKPAIPTSVPPAPPGMPSPTTHPGLPTTKAVP